MTTEQQQTGAADAVPPAATAAALAYGQAKARETMQRLGGSLPDEQIVALAFSIGFADGFFRGRAVGAVEALLANCANDARAAS